MSPVDNDEDSAGSDFGAVLALAQFLHWRRSCILIETVLPGTQPIVGVGGGSFSQVDHASRTILFNGKPFLAAGWYYSLFDNANTNLTDFIESPARAGMTLMLMYTFPLLMLHGKNDAIV
eukprot:SAG31_NODE_22222_length_531_cov_0.803241_1_plen_120_part_10